MLPGDFPIPFGPNSEWKKFQPIRSILYLASVAMFFSEFSQFFAMRSLRGSKNWSFKHATYLQIQGENNWYHSWSSKRPNSWEKAHFRFSTLTSSSEYPVYHSTTWTGKHNLKSLYFTFSRVGHLEYKRGAYRRCMPTRGITSKIGHFKSRFSQCSRGVKTRGKIQ